VGIYVPKARKYYNTKFLYSNMGIFSFLKKKVEEQQVKEIVVLPRGELLGWIEKKKEEHRNKEEVFLLPFNERIGILVRELESEIEVIEGLDISDRKVEERVKAIVRKNLKNYIMYLRKMIVQLKNINKREEFIEKVNEAINDFEIKSNISYQKASFLVGKDIQGTKKIIRKFLVDLGKILKESKGELEEFEVIDSIDKDAFKIKGIKEERASILKSLNEDDNRLQELGQNLKKKLKEIDDLRGSEKFKAEEKKKKVLEAMKKDLNKDINNLHMLIDFKGLLRFYHQFEKEMKLVKEYQDNFRLAIKSLKFDKLMDLLKEAKLENPKVFGLMQIIEDKEKTIAETTFEDFGVDVMTRDSESIRDDISRVNIEKTAKDKKIKIFNESLGNIFEKVKEALGKISVELK
jgi:hypothetical protein